MPPTGGTGGLRPPSQPAEVLSSLQHAYSCRPEPAPAPCAADAEPSNPVLEALSYGRALAETVGGRAAAALNPENVLAELGKANAELSHAIR